MTAHAAAVTRLETALVSLGEALSVADLDRLLEVESELGAALETVSRLPAGGVDADVRKAVDAARVALMRCRRLGAALVEFTRTSLDPRGELAYSRLTAVPKSVEVRG